MTLNGSPGRRHLLIDIGLSPRMTTRRLEAHGLGLEDVSDILLTHPDRDHFSASWEKAFRRLDVTLHAHRRHRSRIQRSAIPHRRLRYFEQEVRLGVHTDIRGVLLAHDQLGSVGYIVEHGDRRLGYATDLGCVPSTMLEEFVLLDALALESNYDRRLQVRSERPAFLKRRIMGGLGHLSNDQALEAVLHIDTSSNLSHLVLLHLSEQCNDSAMVKRLYDQRAPHLHGVLTIAEQDEPTAMLEVQRLPPAPPRAPAFSETLFE